MLFSFLNDSLSTQMGLTTCQLYTFISCMILSSFTFVYYLYLLIISFSPYNSTMVYLKNFICYYLIESYYYFELSYAFKSFSLFDCSRNKVMVYYLNWLLVFELIFYLVCLLIDFCICDDWFFTLLAWCWSDLYK